MQKRDRQSLSDMLTAARKLRDYAQETSREALPSQPMRLDAVLYGIVVLGEAARRLSAEIRAAHPEVLERRSFDSRLNSRTRQPRRTAPGAEPYSVAGSMVARRRSR
jgi:hypothetical protein